MPTMSVVELPQHNIGDVASGLRRLADDIERGEYGDAHNLVWVIDAGSGRIELGLLGHAGEPGALSHFLLALGQRKLERAGDEE